MANLINSTGRSETVVVLRETLQDLHTAGAFACGCCLLHSLCCVHSLRQGEGRSADAHEEGKHVQLACFWYRFSYEFPAFSYLNRQRRSRATGPRHCPSHASESAQRDAIDLAAHDHGRTALNKWRHGPVRTTDPPGPTGVEFAGSERMPDAFLSVLQITTSRSINLTETRGEASHG